jgi:hypothetical protein
VLSTRAPTLHQLRQPAEHTLRKPQHRYSPCLRSVDHDLDFTGFEAEINRSVQRLHRLLSSIPPFAARRWLDQNHEILTAVSTGHRQPRGPVA